MSRKHTMKHVTGVFEAEGYKVIDKDYINNKLPVKVVCPQGHLLDLSYTRFTTKGHRCGLCSDRKFEYTTENIKEQFELAQYTITSNKELNSRSRVEYICSEGHWWGVSYHRFLGGARCPQCSGGGWYSSISQEWLGSLGIPKRFREYRIDLDFRFIKVGGFDPGTNTVCEFLGDYWHGNPDTLDPNSVNVVNGRTFAELYSEWELRKEELSRKGYRVVYVWESDYKEGIMRSE